MKQLIVTLTFILTTVALLAQNISTDVYYTSKDQLGATLYKTTTHGFIYGIGGSLLTNSYKGEVWPKYEELANYLLSVNNGADWSKNYAPYIYKTFTENRGTLKALLGFNVKALSVYANLGMIFRTEYQCGKDGNAATSPAEPIHRYFYVYKNVPSTFLYGISISYKVYKRLNLYTGWTNGEQYHFGLGWTITPTKILNW